MSTYFVAYLQIKIQEKWESVGPFNRKGKLENLFEVGGIIRDLFSNYSVGRSGEEFTDYRPIFKEDFTSNNFSPELMEELKSFFTEEEDREEIVNSYYQNGYVKYTSLAALHQYILLHPTVTDYDDEWEENKPAPKIDNPIKEVYNRAIMLLDMMNYYLFSALDEENVRIVYFLG